jgi:N-acetylglucosamine-6-phosphate deacetylase
MSEPLQIVNGRIITPFRILTNRYLLLEGGTIRTIGDDSKIDPALPTIDALGNWIAPGFIDLHLHGGGGYDFSDNTEKAITQPAITHARYGTTSMAPTTLACDFGNLKKLVSLYDSVATESCFKGANLLGLHLEGPYFSPEQRGAQDLRFLKNPKPEEYNSILALSDRIIRWDSAPELPGSFEFAEALRRRGVQPAIAHSAATFDQALEAREHGFTHVTHFYSGTSTVRRIGLFRVAGVNEFAYLFDDVTVEIIADGCHLPASLLKLIYKIKGPSRTVLITDAIRASGTDMKSCRIGDAETGLEVIIEDGVAKLPDRSSFAGSIATTNRLVRNMVYLGEVPLTDAVRMATATPATVIGINNRKGILAPGFDADVVVFDEDFEIQNTIVGGVEVYRAGSDPG